MPGTVSAGKVSAVINIMSQFGLTNKLFLGDGEEKAQSEWFLNLYKYAQLKGRRDDGENIQGKTNTLSPRGGAPDGARRAGLHLAAMDST